MREITEIESSVTVGLTIAGIGMLGLAQGLGAAIGEGIRQRRERAALDARTRVLTRGLWSARQEEEAAEAEIAAAVAQSRLRAACIDYNALFEAI
jgi:hypothetical protein